MTAEEVAAELAEADDYDANNHSVLRFLERECLCEPALDVDTRIELMTEAMAEV